ncbi:hypothetical protein RND81_12G084800 [Saponaria officinalis]|uniref:Uncharacterized protein n=1 Tax=Saponaria officinalis TaxID=3572 RepID=A0AAW1H846_SAPOF
MPHSVEHSNKSLQSDSLLPKRVTYFPLQLPNKWLTNNQTTIKTSGNHKASTIITTRPHNEYAIPSKSCLNWVTTLLHKCGTAINEKNPNKIHQLLWLLNEFGSPYGDCDQRLAYYFLQALIVKVHNQLASLRYENLKSVVSENKYCCFKTKMDLILKFQEVSPWTTFGHVASNGVILEALEDHEKNLHVIDLSNTLCTQWPTLIEALATRYDETPSLRLTLVVTTTLDEFLVQEVSQRMEKFARLMCVPFKLDVISGLNCIEELKIDDLGLQEGETIVVNCIQALQRVQVDKREIVLNMIKLINPKIITIVEEEVNLTTTRDDFAKTFEECLRFYGLYFEMLEESFGTISSDRIRLEKERLRDMIRVLACGGDDNGEIGNYWMPNRAIEWSNMLKNNGLLLFHPIKYSDEVVGDIKALLRRYKKGFWDVIDAGNDHNNNYNEVGIHLTWKNEKVVWASAWKLT